MLDTHLHDLDSLMIRVMKNGKWDKEKAEEIINNYSTINPVKSEELFIMKEFIRFPQAYWQLGIQKYWEEQPWKESVFIDKLKKYIEDREDREDFLKNFM